MALDHLSKRNNDKAKTIFVARRLFAVMYSTLATSLTQSGLPAKYNSSYSHKVIKVSRKEWTQLNFF